jgi:outer membrane protein TolC
MRISDACRGPVALAGGVLALVALTDPPLALGQTGLGLRDALRDALRLNPNISLQQQQVLVNRGAELVAQGQFDPLASGSIGRSRDLRPLREDEKNALPQSVAPFNTQISNAITYGVGVDRTLQSGVALGASVGVTTLYDNVSGANSIPAQTAGRISFSVRAPLLRNAGTEATTANLSAAEAELSGARYDLLFSNAQTLLNTTLAYWGYLAQARRLDIARDAEARSTTLVKETRRLIDADELPAADSQLVLASNSDRVRSRIAAEQALAEARRVLALQIGLPPERLVDLPPPADDFPRYDGQPLGLDAPIGSLLDFALNRRADFAAAKQRERAARRRVDAARSGLEPQLDLTVGAGYNSLVESRAPSVGQVIGNNRVGPTISATLAAQLPWRNSAAEGAFLAQSATLSASLISVRSLSDSIGANVLTDVQALVRGAAQLAQSIETSRFYGHSVENERTKRRLGLVTLIDVINVEDRLTDALTAEVQARQTYANAIAQLRFDLGTIVLERDGQFEVMTEDLFNPNFEIQR